MSSERITHIFTEENILRLIGGNKDNEDKF